MKNYKFLRYFAYTIEILVFFMVQETPGLFPEVLGARPVLLIPIALSIAMFENETVSMSFGLLCGLLIDLGAGGVLGFYGLMLSVICYYIGLIAANLIQTNFLTAIIIAIVVTAGLSLLQWIFFFVLFGYKHVGYALIMHFLPHFLYTSAIMPVAYFFNRALAFQIRSKGE